MNVIIVQIGIEEFLMLLPDLLVIVGVDLTMESLCDAPFDK
jgi:hypothetical protein